MQVVSLLIGEPLSVFPGIPPGVSYGLCMFAAPFSNADLLAMHARSALTVLLDLRKDVGVGPQPPIPIQQSRQELQAFRLLQSNRGHTVSVAFIDFQLRLADQGDITLGATKQQITEYARAVGIAIASSH